MVTFEIKCYEKDWKYILKGHYLKKVIAQCNYPFLKRNLIINNVKNRKKIEKIARLLVSKGVIDSYYFVDDYKDEVLSFFNLSKKELGEGFKYSISELTGIFVCDTPYLLHFASDSFLPQDGNEQLNWIDEAISLFVKDDTILSANPTWNYKYDEAKTESFSELDNFWCSHGFSDQCYLIRTNDFKKDIYHDRHIDSNRYPAYGGELFEKRIDSYMRNNNRTRITHKHCSYIHANFPKRAASRFLYYVISKLLFRDMTLLFREHNLSMINHKREGL